MKGSRGKVDGECTMEEDERAEAAGQKTLDPRRASPETIDRSFLSSSIPANSQDLCKGNAESFGVKSAMPETVAG